MAAIEICPNEMIKKWPRYNPLMIELAMDSRGFTTAQVAMALNTPVSTVGKLIKGEIEATERQVKTLCLHLDYPESFFMQWPKFKMKWDGGCMAQNVQIGYRAYKIIK